MLSDGELVVYSIRNRNRRSALACLLVAAMLVPASLVAEDSTKPDQPITTTDPRIPTDELALIIDIHGRKGRRMGKKGVNDNVKAARGAGQNHTRIGRVLRVVIKWVARVGSMIGHHHLVAHAGGDVQGPDRVGNLHNRHHCCEELPFFL